MNALSEIKQVKYIISKSGNDIVKITFYIQVKLGKVISDIFFMVNQMYNKYTFQM